MTDGGYTMTEGWNLQLQARVRRLEAALQKIGACPRGGLVVQGKPSGDRDEMIEIARTALKAGAPEDSENDERDYDFTPRVES